MIIPELPNFLTELGGAEYKGFIISLFTLTAMISRPFSGKLADSIGRVPVMMFGSLVCLACSLVYPILATVSGFMILRLMHGFSTGFTPTGQTAYLGDVIPFQRRGEAMGILGTAGTLGMAGGPAIGGAVANNFSLDVMFYCSSLFAMISVMILIGIQETVKEKHPIRLSLLKIEKADLFEPRVIAPCVVMALCAYSFGALLTVIPDFGEFVEIKNKGLLFTYFTVSSLIIRLVGGKASDMYGREVVLKISTFLIMISMIVIGMAETKGMLIAGVSLLGFAQGATSPTLLAWASDLSHEQRKGRGVASLYIFMEFGIGMGAFISGWVYGNNAGNFMATFLICAVLSFFAFVYLLIKPVLIKK